GEIDQDVLVDAVVVPGIVRRLLIGPFRLPGIGIPREDRHRPFVVAGPLIRIPGPGVPAAVVQEVQLRVVAVPAPGRPAASFPLIALPALNRAWNTTFCLRARPVPVPDLF